MSVRESNPIVVKISGSLLDDPEQLAELGPALRTLQSEAPIVLVHGGGKQMTALADRLGHTPERVQGRRITGDLDLKIAQWAMRGALNTRLVSHVQQHDLTAVGVSGADARLVRVSKRPAWDIDGEEVDFGWVGDIEDIDPSLVKSLLDQSLVPVVAPLGIDGNGQVYNVNADTVACALAEALSAEMVLLVTETGAVRRHADDPASQLDACDADTFAAGVEEGWISGGMRVKIETALDVLQEGVGRAFICGADDVLTRTNATEVVR